MSDGSFLEQQSLLLLSMASGGCSAALLSGELQLFGAYLARLTAPNSSLDHPGSVNSVLAGVDYVSSSEI